MMTADAVNHIRALSIILQQEQDVVKAVSELYNNHVQANPWNVGCEAEYSYARVYTRERHKLTL